MKKSVVLVLQTLLILVPTFCFGQFSSGILETTCNGLFLKGILSGNDITYSCSTVPDSALSGNYSGVGSCSAGQAVVAVNDNAAPSCDSEVAFTDESNLWSQPQTIDNAQELRLAEADGSGTNFLAFKAPSVVTSNQTCTLEDDANSIPDSCVGDGVEALRVICSTTAASSAVSNTTSETNFSTTCTLPANVIVTAGTFVRVKGFGNYSTTGTPTLTIRVKIGSQALAAAVITTGSSVSNHSFSAEGGFVARTTGSSGSMNNNFGAMLFTTTGAGHGGSAGFTLNTTTSHTIQISVQWGTASSSNTATLQHLSVELLTPEATS